MKKLAACLLLIILSQRSNSESYNFLFNQKVNDYSQQPALTELMEAVNEKENMKVRFSQKKYVDALDREFISKGWLYLVKDHGIIWQTDTPYYQKLYISGDGDVFELEKDGPNASFPYAGAILDIFDSDLNKLARAFDLYFLPQTDGWLLGLRPTRRIIRRHIDQIVISGSNDGDINKVDIHNKDGSPVKFSFKDHELLSETETNEIKRIFQEK